MTDQGKRHKFGRKAAAACMLAVAICIAWYQWSRVVDSYFKARIGALLLDAGDEFGIAVSYGEAEYHPIFGARLLDVTVAPASTGEFEYLIRIPEVRIDYSISLRPSVKIGIEKIALKGPSIHLQTGSVDYLEFSKEFLHSGSDGSVSLHDEGESHLPAGRVEWTGGKLLLERIESAEVGAKALFRLSDLDGNAYLDPADRSYAIDAVGEVADMGGYLGLNLQARGGAYETTLYLKGFKPDSISPYLPSLMRLVDGGTLGGKIRLRMSPDNSVISVLFDLDVDELILNHWRIADHPVRGIDLRSKGMLDWDVDNDQLKLDDLSLAFGNSKVDVAGSMDFHGHRLVDASISMDRTQIQMVLDDLPDDLIPMIRGAKVDGSVAMNIDLAVDLDNLNSLQLNPVIDIEDFHIVRMPDQVDIDKLKGRFMHKVRMDGEVVKTLTLDPSERDFISYKNLGEFTIKGVLTCEDGSFFYHNGFQMRHIRDSLVQNIRDRRFTRGASTITMQVAKNLFLSGRKDISRKFQEMLIAYALEQELDKKRILEIYMNIIEWGPDIYGIGPAARHYFDKKPSELTALEAAFLGSIISNPKRYHYMYKDGGVGDQWATYLSLILSKMNIGIDEYENARPFEPEFGWVRKQREAREGEGDDNTDL